MVFSYLVKNNIVVNFTVYYIFLIFFDLLWCLDWNYSRLKIWSRSKINLTVNWYVYHINLISIYIYLFFFLLRGQIQNLNLIGLIFEIFSTYQLIKLWIQINYFALINALYFYSSITCCLTKNLDMYNLSFSKCWRFCLEQLWMKRCKS